MTKELQSNKSSFDNDMKMNQRHQLQEEIKARVKPGIKPSQLRKSKSLSSIPKVLPLPKLTKSAQELEPASSKIEELEAKVSVLELKLEVSQRELKENKTETQILAGQLKEKQKELEEIQSSLGSLNKELDQALTKRHQNLKDWFNQYQKTKKLDSELAENIEEASSELVSQDQVISSLRTENNQLKAQNKQLTQDLELVQRLVELRKEPLSLESSWPAFPSFSWIALALTVLALWIWIKNYD